VSLDLGVRRLSPCGAGAKYVSVSHDGGLFLCHRFAGDRRYRVGNVEEGLDRNAVARMLGQLARPASCERCWAFGLCGGLCFHELQTRLSAPKRDTICSVTRRTLELSMWLYASLPAPCRERLSVRTRRGLRPHVNLV
jgi:uncharacterized protein